LPALLRGWGAGELTHDEVSAALHLCERYTVNCGEGSTASPKCYNLPACRVIQHRFYTDLLKVIDADHARDLATIEDVARRAKETEK